MAIGLLFGLTQWLVLRRMHHNNGVSVQVARLLWTPMTAIGIVAMLLPLWRISVDTLFWVPGSGLFVMVQGIVLLSALQCVLICLVFPGESWFWRIAWFWRTAIGAALGGALGFHIALILFNFLFIPIEIGWAGTMGLFIGKLQSRCVDRLSSSRNGACGTQPADPK